MAYQKRVLEVGTTFLPEDNGVWTMADCTGNGKLDLVYIKTRNTGTGKVEVHVASAESNFQTRIIETGTTFAPEDNGTWMMGDFNGDGKADLIYIKTSKTGTGKVEVHVASAQSGYQTRIFETGTTFAQEENGTWTMADTTGSKKLDLIYIKTSNTGTGKVEVHVASAASQYQSRTLETGTTFAPETDGTWLMSHFTDRTHQDLVFIKTSNTGTRTVEIHVATATSKYQTRVFEAGTTFAPETDGVWMMGNYTHHERPDLIFIKTSNTGTGRVEVHIATSSTE